MGKEGGIAALAPHLGAVVKAYLIGQAADEFAATLDKAGVPYERSGTLATATADALREARA